MSDRSPVAMTTRERFMQLAQDEMSAFERREFEFRKKAREERAVQLRIPIDTDDL